MKQSTSILLQSRSIRRTKSASHEITQELRVGDKDVVMAWLKAAETDCGCCGAGCGWQIVVVWCLVTTSLTT